MRTTYYNTAKFHLDYTIDDIKYYLLEIINDHQKIGATMAMIFHDIINTAIEDDKLVYYDKNTFYEEKELYDADKLNVSRALNALIVEGKVFYDFDSNPGRFYIT